MRQYDHKGRTKNFVFVEFETKEAAEKAVEDTGRANVLGRKLTINYKVTKTKILEDKDCWFCFNNPNVMLILLLFRLSNI